MLLTVTGNTHDDTSKFHIVSVKIDTTFSGKRLSPIRLLNSAPSFSLSRHKCVHCSIIFISVAAHNLFLLWTQMRKPLRWISLM